MTIALSFTVVSVCCLCFLGILLYKQFSRKEETLVQENSRQLLEQTTINLEDYLRSMRRISDAMYYSVIKDKDLEQESMDEEMTLLYEANKDNLVSIACYTYDGGLVEATPVANEKEMRQSHCRTGLSMRKISWKIFTFRHRMYRICLMI